MADFDRFAPATKRRAFFILMALAVRAIAAPTPGQSSPDYIQLAKPEPAEISKIVAQLQQAGIAGQFYLEFELHVLPRKGDERVLPGKMWGARNEQGAITRVAVTDFAGQERRWLLQNGPHPAAWSFAGGKLAQIGTDALLEPLVPGVDIAPFDLEMPFVYWPDYTLENVVRMRNRPAHVFLFRPPATFAAQHAEITGVRVYLDTQFNAPVQTEIIGREGQVVKTLSLLELKKIGDQTMLKSLDVRNEATRDKTRFQVTGAALGSEFAPAVFEPATLAEDVRPPPAERITRLGR